MSIIKQIEDRIEKSAIGSVFVITDFTDVSNYDTARKTLSRLEKENKIRKISRGIYFKTKFSNLLGEYVAPNMNNIAEAIARNYEWSITPSGETALNILGISTQVPGRYSYISSGPYRNYSIGNTDIEFYHRTDKELNGKSYKTRLIIQALKAIGKQKIKDYIHCFKEKLSQEDKEILLKESRRTTAWVYDIIKKISMEGTNV